MIGNPNITGSVMLKIEVAMDSWPRLLYLSLIHILLTVAKAVDYLNNAAHAKRKILLICGSCEDAATLCAGAAEIKEVDLGGIRFAEGRTSISNQVFLVEDDLRHLDAIARQGGTVYIQEAPSKPKIPLSEIHSIFEKNKK